MHFCLEEGEAVSGVLVRFTIWEHVVASLHVSYVPRKGDHVKGLKGGPHRVADVIYNFDDDSVNLILEKEVKP